MADLRHWTRPVVSASCACMLERLQIRDFRCFEHAVVEPHPRLTFFTGRNAQGKTSLLEAVCVLMRLQSPRTQRRGEWLRFGAGSCLIEGKWNSLMLRQTQTATARRLAVDGAASRRVADYLAVTARVVWMDHADMNLARGGAEHRRRHLDFVAAQLFPEYLPALRQYERALRARNFLLKRDAVIRWREVDAFGAMMDRAAKVIRSGRDDLVSRMKPWVADAQHALGAGEVAGAAYAPGFTGGSLQERLLSLRDEEARTRQTAAGTHRDDVELTVNGRDASAFASEGQQRTLSLSMKLAQARVLEASRGAAPILLLDDVFGELDPVRRRALLDYFPSAWQKLITTTSLQWLEGEGPEAAVFHVDCGTLIPKIIG